MEFKVGDTVRVKSKKNLYKTDLGQFNKKDMFRYCEDTYKIIKTRDNLPNDYCRHTLKPVSTYGPLANTIKNYVWKDEWLESATMAGCKSIW